MENRYLLATDAAKLLRCSSQNIRQLEKAGTLKVAFKTVGGVRIFDSAEIQRLAVERKQKDSKRA
jgi:DNA-binding transcriptional MerR regulator